MITTHKLLLYVNRAIYVIAAAMLMSGMVLTVVQEPAAAAPSICPTGYMLTIPDEGDTTAPFCIPQKVTVCHRNNGGVGYAAIDVSINSVTSNEDWWENGHGQHTIAGGEVGFPEDAWPNFYARNGDFIAAYGDQALVANSCSLPVVNTATPTNTATNTPTNTMVPPTNTPTNTELPATNTPTNTPTNTELPPTNTPTDTPTNTAVPPTNTPPTPITQETTVDEVTSTPTNTPDPTATPGDPTIEVSATPEDPGEGQDPTPVPTLPVPVDPGPNVVESTALLIPVTGMNVTTGMHRLTYGGLGMLGLGLVLSGVRRKFED